MIDKLPYFKAGDWRHTPMNSGVMNGIVERINKLQELLRTMRGKGNIRVYSSKGNIIISDIPTDPNTGAEIPQGGTTVVSGSGGGTVNNYYTYCVARWA